MISVIVPVYKVEPYLARCVDSILAQTYTDFELILVDDGSPDNCGAMCDAYAEQDKRIHVIHKENGGLSDARNVGIEFSKGDYITFIDSDDLVHPQTFELLMQSLKKSEAEISMCGFQRFTDAIPCSHISAEDSWRVISGREACKEMKGYGYDCVKYVVSWAKLYHSDLFEDIRFPVGRKHEDEMTTYKLLLKASKVAVIPDKLYYYWQNPNGIMGNSSLANRKDFFDALRDRATYYAEHGEPELARETSGWLQWLITENVFLAKEAGVKNNVPHEYRIPTWKALARMYRNSEYRHFQKYLKIACPWASLPVDLLHKMLHKDTQG